MSQSFEVRGEIGILWIDHPPVNAIDVGVRQFLIDGLGEAERSRVVRGIVIACRGRTFMAGADITEFGAPPKSPQLGDVLRALDHCSKPLAAALHGTALGGGFEIALACDYRVALASAQVGLPEVKLGIIPGGGGTQRLPRLIGIARALETIVSGEPLPAMAAQAAGAIDRVVEHDHVEAAVVFLREKLSRSKVSSARHRVRDLPIDTSSLPTDFFSAARTRLAREKRNLFAPQRIVDALEAAATLPFDTGLARERELILACFANSQSKALRHIFFAERQVATIPGIGADVRPRAVAKAAVIGAGTMGGGIAMNFANAGIPVTVLEMTQAALDRGLGVVRRNYEASAARGRLTPAAVEERMRLIRPTLAYEDLADADLIIEAVFETLDIKTQVFEQLDRVAKPGALLASNTSYLSIDKIAAATGRPGDVLGMHFFSPANVMRLLEIVRGAATAPEVLATALEVAKRIRKVGVIAGNRDGFIGNRMLAGYAHQAQLLMLEGASAAEIDAALRDFGMPMGVFQMSDLAGLDIGYKSRKDRDPASYDRKAVRVADLLVESGRLGQKTQAGYYDYAPGDRTPKPSALVTELSERVAREYGIRRRTIGNEEIVERCFLALANVGCEVLREKVAYRASDIDVVYVNGYGFPAYRGGPMFWLEHEVGLAAALEKLKTYGARIEGGWLKPSPFLIALVAEGRGLS
jgi:3-hydroxyacyl-CoA dehydrogenase